MMEGREILNRSREIFGIWTIYFVVDLAIIVFWYLGWNLKSTLDDFNSQTLGVKVGILLLFCSILTIFMVTLVKNVKLYLLINGVINNSAIPVKKGASGMIWKLHTMKQYMLFISILQALEIVFWIIFNFSYPIILLITTLLYHKKFRKFNEEYGEICEGSEEQ